MPDINPTLSLREIVYHDMKPFYVVGHKIFSSTLANKVMYQIAQDMPNMYGERRGPWPSITKYFDREDLMNQAEYDAARLVSLESTANEYERTLTGIPIIRTNVGVLTNYKFVFDGTESFEWDGEAYPPYENPIALGTSWFDWVGTGIIATLTDVEDGGGSNPIATINHVGNISWDGTSLVIDNPEFILLSSIQFIDPDIYYINQLPSDLRWDDVWLIGSSAFLISLVATLYPAWLASRTQPAEALRYE